MCTRVRLHFIIIRAASLVGAQKKRLHVYINARAPKNKGSSTPGSPSSQERAYLWNNVRTSWSDGRLRLILQPQQKHAA